MSDVATPHDLCRELLTRLDRAGVFKNRVLVGGWCGYFYKYFFADLELPLDARGIDFAAAGEPPPKKPSPELLAALRPAGFVPEAVCDGYVRLARRELVVELLVPRTRSVGRRPAPRLDPQRLRLMELLLAGTVSVHAAGLKVRLPCPVRFAFQKLIVSRRGRKPGRRAMDRLQAVGMLDAVLARDEGARASSIFRELPPDWKKAVVAGLQDAGRPDLADLLGERGMAQR